MKLTIITIGKKDEPEYADAIADFTRRAGHYFDIEWKILPSAKETSAPIEKQKQEEGEKILSKIQPADFVILLDERGNSISSITFADMLSKHIDKGTKHIVCIIGGAFGVSEVVLKRANFTLSLSKLVFPHQLVRLLCIEQIYRAGTIIKGEKYHHV
jgi:23S rRNA (pseudouridine1915-N3)-methyltransferase